MEWRIYTGDRQCRSLAQAGWLPLSDADSDSNSDGNSYSDGDIYADGNGDIYTNSNRYVYTDGDCDSHSYCDSDRYIYTDGNSHSHSDSRLNADTNADNCHYIWHYLLLLKSSSWPSAKCDS